MTRGKIDADQLREMIRNRKTAGEICAAFGCTQSSLTKFRHYHGIEKPIRTYRGRPAAPVAAPAKQAPAKPATVHPPRLAELIATGGRYADLRAWAQRWGVTETKARQEWFGLRLPVMKGVSHG